MVRAGGADVEARAPVRWCGSGDVGRTIWSMVSSGMGRAREREGELGEEKGREFGRIYRERAPGREETRRVASWLPSMSLRSNGEEKRLS
jgi:hypothetical protein